LAGARQRIHEWTRINLERLRRNQSSEERVVGIEKRADQKKKHEAGDSLAHLLCQAQRFISKIQP